MLDLAERLLTQGKEGGASLVGPGGLLNQLTKSVLETVLEAELTQALGNRLGANVLTGYELTGGGNFVPSGPDMTPAMGHSSGVPFHVTEVRACPLRVGEVNGGSAFVLDHDVGVPGHDRQALIGLRRCEDETVIKLLAFPSACTVP